MRSDSSDESAARARWLAELAQALLHAQELTWRFGQAVGENAEAMDLFGRIEAVRGEVRSLQLRNVSGRDGKNGPEWISGSPWCPPDA